MNKSMELKEYILNLGASKVGFADVGAFLPEYLSHLNSGVSIAIRLSDETISHIKNEPTHTYYHHYRTVNAFIDQITLQITMKIQEMGYLAIAIPSSQSINDNKGEREYKALLSHKMVATLSGLGYIGKSALLVTEEFGPRVRLGTILTNMPLEYGNPISESKCGECNICTRLCPAFAIKGVNWDSSKTREDLYDPRACSSHMNNHYYHIGRGSVCGICIKNCPKGKNILKR